MWSEYTTKKGGPLEPDDIMCIYCKEFVKGCRMGMDTGGDLDAVYDCMMEKSQDYGWSFDPLHVKAVINDEDDSLFGYEIVGDKIRTFR